MSEKSFSFSIDPWSIVSENKEYQTPIFNLFKRSMKLESADEQLSGDFYVLKVPEWANVLPITSENTIILVEQYRYGIQQPTLEIPGGIVDPSEEPLEAVKRELAEETGYYSDSWSSLGKVSANPAIMTNYSHIYLAEDCTFEGMKESTGDLHERIKVHEMPIEEFLSLVDDGTIHHSIMLAAVAKYLLYVKRET